MNRLATALLYAAALVAFGAPQFSAAANTEPLNVEADILAKLAKEKAKRHGADSRGVNSSGSAAAMNADQDAPCGNVDIGNFVSNGRGGRAPKDITVVITGDVINANNKCR